MKPDSSFKLGRSPSTQQQLIDAGHVPGARRGKRGFVLHRGRPRRRGAAVAEFAIVAPVFFLMVMGFIEFGRALMVQQVLVNAARVGARQAVLISGTTSAVQTAVAEYAAGVAVPGVNVSVTPDPASAIPGTTITVTTSVPFNDVSWASPWFLGGTSLTSSSVMRKEGFQ